MKRAWLFALLLVFSIAVALIAVGIPMSYMHPDEQLAYVFTRRPLPELWTYLGTQDTHPPLWFSSFWLWRRLVGDSELLARVYSAFLGMITLTLVYQLARRWFGAPRFGFFAVALLGVNGFFLYHVLELRPYSLIMLLVTLSMWCLTRWLSKRTFRTATFYGATVAAMLYVHYFLMVIILIQALWILLVLLRDLVRRRDSTLLRQGIVAVVTAVLLWLPWLPSAIFQVNNLRAQEIVGGNQRGVVGAGTTTVVTSSDALLQLADLATNDLLLVYVAILLLGVVLLMRRSNYCLALAWAIGAPALSFLLNFVIAIYTPRYVVYMVIGLTIAVGAVLATLPARLRVVALMAVLGLSLWTLPGQRNDLMPNRTPFRDLYRRASEFVQPGDVIFFDQGGTNQSFFKWHVQQYLSRTFTRVESVEEATTYPRIWYVTDDLYNERRQQRFQALEQDHPLQQVIGKCDSDWCYVIQLLAVAES